MQAVQELTNDASIEELDFLLNRQRSVRPDLAELLEVGAGRPQPAG